MTKGAIALQGGFTGEFNGWRADTMWSRVLAIAELAEREGFPMLRMPDHLQNVRTVDDSPALESFSVLSAVAMRTTRPTLGQTVLCAAFRNPAVMVKQITTLDVISGGRAELGLGAGWFEPEWRGYGIPFPSARERLAILEETLEIATRMLKPGRASWQGNYAGIDEVICEPKGHPGHDIPIIVGGNGQNVTWRLAARFADELSLEGPSVDQVKEWLPIIRSRCEEVDRDPATLAVSAEVWWNRPETMHRPRVEQLEEFKELGLSCVQTYFASAVDSDEPIIAFAEDCRAAGLTMLDVA